MKKRQCAAVVDIIERFGGRSQVANILGIHESNVSKWKYVIPGEHALKLYCHAKKRGWKVKLEDMRPDIFKRNYEPRYYINQ